MVASNEDDVFAYYCETKEAFHVTNSQILSGRIAPMQKGFFEKSLIDLRHLIFHQL